MTWLTFTDQLFYTLSSVKFEKIGSLFSNMNYAFIGLLCSPAHYFVKLSFITVVSLLWH